MFSQNGMQSHLWKCQREKDTHVQIITYVWGPHQKHPGNFFASKTQDRLGSFLKATEVWVVKPGLTQVYVILNTRAFLYINMYIHVIVICYYKYDAFLTSYIFLQNN